MRLRSRMVRDAGDDASAVASASSSSMDENSSTEAVLGSPVTRRSTDDSQNLASSPAPVASSAPYPNPLGPHAYDPRPPRGEHNTYLTDYETATQAEHGDYPAEISVSDSQSFHDPAYAQAQLEGSNLYVQPSPAPYNASHIYGMDSNPHTPTQNQPQPTGYQYPYMTPASQPPAHNQFPGYGAQGQYPSHDSPYTPHSTTPTTLTYPPPQPQFPNHPNAYMTPYTQTPSRNAEYQEPTLAPYHNTSPPFVPIVYQQTSQWGNYPSNPLNQPSLHTPVSSAQPHPLQLAVQTSETLNRFVAPDTDQPWSPSAQPNTESLKRRISEADSTVGFEHNKMRTELDEMEAGDVGQGKKKRKRWTRGKPRGRGPKGGSRDRGGGGGRKRGGGGGGGKRGGEMGRGEGVRS